MNQQVFKMRHYLHVFIQIWKRSAAHILEYRLNIFIQGAFILVYLVGMLMMLEIIFSNTQSLGGWSKSEVILLYGICGIMWGLIELVYFSSLMHFMMRGVSTGELDTILTKPLDAQFLTLFSYPAMMEFIYPFSSALFTGWVLLTQHYSFSLESVFTFFASIILTQILLLFLFSAYSSLAFFVTKSQQVLRTLETLGDHSQYPTIIYPQLLKLSLLSFLGVGLVGYIPTAFLLQKLPTLGLVPLFLGTCATVFTSRFIWKFSLRRYSSASS